MLTCFFSLCTEQRVIAIMIAIAREISSADNAMARVPFHPCQDAVARGLKGWITVTKNSSVQSPSYFISAAS